MSLRTELKPTHNGLSAKVLYLISFVEGAAVMNVELVAAKMIGPYYGSSLYVWASVLAVTLAGLASGYFLGGVMSKKSIRPGTLFYGIALASVMILIMPLWGNFVMKGFLNLSVQSATLLSCMLFLFPPLLMLGMISPLIIGFVAENGIPAGKASGTVYAISTVGGIIMTILTGFYLIPEFGLRISAYIIGVTFGLIPIIYFFYLGRFIIATLLIFCSLFFIAQKRLIKKGPNVPFHVMSLTDGVNGQLLVGQFKTQEKRVLQINNIAQTFIHVPTGRSLWPYVHRLAFYSSYKPAGSKVLLCGLGGGNLVNEFNNLGFKTDAVDIDKRMETIAKKYFNMTSNANIITDDARHYIKTCKKKYDIIVLDLSLGETQPANMYSIESFKEIKNILMPDGMLFVHYQNVLKGEDALGAKSIGKTLQSAGFICSLLNTRNDPEKVNEIMFFASNENIGIDTSVFERRDPFGDPFKFPRGGLMYIKNYDFSDGIVLTDNKPIIEFLSIKAARDAREASIRDNVKILLQAEQDII